MVANITFEFNKPKAIETILYLANKIDYHDIYGICKLLYLADKISLENYGRFIFGETYCAMKGGGTPSHAYDLLKNTDNKELRIDGVEVIALREANIEHFSKSDLECLDFIVNKYGKVSNLRRARDAHDNAWKAAWEQRGEKKSITIPVTSIAKQFSDSEDLISYLCNSDVG